MGAAIQHLDEDTARLATLIWGFASRATESRKLIREMLEQDRDRFHAAAVEILKAPDDSKGYRFLISLLMGCDMLLEALSDAALSHAEAAAAARSASQVHSMMEVSLARRAAGEGFSPSRVASDRTRLMIDILGEISKDPRVLGSLRSMARHPDPHLRSKAVLMIGRQERDAGWAQHRLAEADPRVRANAIEALWGRYTEEARAVLRLAACDPQ